MPSRMLAALFGVLAALPCAASGRGLALFSLEAGQQQDWRLVVEVSQVAGWRSRPPDARLRRLAVAGLRVESGSPDRLRDLAGAAGAGSHPLGWALLDPRRKVIASGEGTLAVDQVEAALRDALGALPWDVLEGVLKSQPDHGEARLAYAEWALAQVELFRSWNPPIRDYWVQDRAQGVVAEAHAALERLLEVPDWPSQVALASADPQELGYYLRRLAPYLGDSVQRMGKQVLAALAADPDNPRLQANAAYLFLLQQGEGAERLQEQLEGILPLPGQGWPPEPLILAFADLTRRGKRWERLKDQCAEWSRPVDRLFLERGTWERHVHREAVLEALRCLAGSWLEGPESLLAGLESLRQHAGGGYRELAQLAMNGAQILDDRKFREELGRQLAKPSRPLPPQPEGLPPWRVEVQGAEDLKALRADFDTHAGLLRWLPGERELALGSRPGWQLMLGAMPTQGGGRLDSERLADTMLAGRPGRLFQVWERVLRDPDSQGPRRQRVALLRQRMPVKALEPILAEDLRRARLGIGREDWPFDENLWFAEAQRALPLIEEQLRRWPLDAERWKALAFWSGFVPRHPGPSQLAEELPSWQPGLPLRLCLPASVHGEVGVALTEGKAWPALRAWFEPAWRELQGLPRKESRAQALQRELAPVFQAQLARAYRELGLTGELKQLGESLPEQAAER